MGDTMQGRRIPAPKSGDGNEVIFALEAGDYCGPIDGYTGGKPAVFFRLPVASGHPDAGIRHVVSPPHAFTEQPDAGGLTVDPIAAPRRRE